MAKAHYEDRRSELSQNLRGIGVLLRDALIPYMPRPIVRMMVGDGQFVFIAHPRDQRDVTRMFPFAKYLPARWVKKWFMHQKPFIASRIRGLKDRRGHPVNGWFLIAPRWTVQMMKDNAMARECIAQAVKLSEKLGAKIAGLGAFTSIVTHDGTDLLPRTDIGLTTGNPLSAAVAVQNVIKAADLVQLDLSTARAAIVGAAGSVGSGCARLLVTKMHNLTLVDINKKALAELAGSLGEHKAVLVCEYDLKSLREADIVIVATNTPGALVHSKDLKSGCIVVDCAQPKNVSEEVPRDRNDVLVIESAVVETPGIDVQFDLDVRRYEALGCLAETMVLTSIGWPGTYAIGKSQAHQLEEMYAAARKTGFRMAYFRNSTGYISEKDIARVRGIVSKRKVIA